MGNQQIDEAATKAEFKLVGFNNFKCVNPKSDKFRAIRFHHVEFWCGDAITTASRFSWGLGMPIVAKSDLSTGNLVHASYLCRSGELRFLFTAPYSASIAAADGVDPAAVSAIPSFTRSACCDFCATHGFGVRAVAVEVEDADVAFATSVANGAKPVLPPVVVDGQAVFAEVHLYGDVVLRYISYKDLTTDPTRFLPRFEPVEPSKTFPLDFGIRRLDHAVGNVPKLGPTVSYLSQFTGFHRFAEFTAEDVGTAESGMNSVVLANNNEMILLPLNEPVYGTKRKSNIQTYLEHNEGPGIHHLALVTEDIFKTLKEMKMRSGVGGFELMPIPPLPETYYSDLKVTARGVLTEEQIDECEELGILVDKDDQGTIMQIFTKPVGDRPYGLRLNTNELIGSNYWPTMFIEVIQRIGCLAKDDEGKEYQKGGCGGFGKGNFAKLFKSIEEYEKRIEAANKLVINSASA